MHPLVSLELAGASLTPFDDLRTGEGVLGHPVWSPEQLLRDLELRSGLGEPEGAEALRVMRWAARMDGFAGHGCFYAASFELDRLGTARAVLELRDALVDAGWDGNAIRDGGPRLDAIAELEALVDPALPSGMSDRVRAVARAIAQNQTPLYEQLTLAEPREAWSGSWNRVFAGLERAGTRVSQLQVALPGASPESDLGKVQRTLSTARTTADRVVPLDGDGTFALLTSETSLEAAAAVAALLSSDRAESFVIIRDGDTSALDHALSVARVATQGLHAPSRWRGPLQVLPLALELAFEPKDPYRVLELLSLPNGPFAGAVGRRMTRALARSPGIGSRAWEEAKARLAEPRACALERLASWVETPGADPNQGAQKWVLVEVLERVRAWLVARVPLAPDDGALFTAIQHCDALRQALEADRRESFDLVAVRRLSEFVMGSGSRAEVIPERAGRVAHVSSAQALWVPRETVIWWAFGARVERAECLPWRRRELTALERGSIHFPSAARKSQLRAQGYRRSVQAATKRLILVVPRSIAGQALGSHALWDEIVARAGLGEVAQAQVTVSVADLLAGKRWSVASEAIVRSDLPAARPEWSVSLSQPLSFERHSATSLNSLLACPLRWVLGSAAGINSEGTGLPAPHQLAGDLGHRLIEELFSAGAFTLPDVEFKEHATHKMDELIQREAAVLLRPGKAHERDQLRRQLIDAACALDRALRENNLVLLAVERQFEVAWRDGKLVGRWDLLAQDSRGRLFIIDIKWGQASYKKALRSGTALQLALYAHALTSEEGSEARAAYFSLSGRRLFSNGESGLQRAKVVEGPAMQETWQRIERTVPVVEQQLQRGRFPVAGLSKSLPLLDSLGVAETDQARHFCSQKKQICEYCRFEGLCGKRWEAFT